MKKEATKTAGKEKRIYIRVTNEERELIDEKAKKYGFPISTLLLDAVKEFDDRKGRNRIDRMIEFSVLANSMDAEIARQGNNLNQIAHNLNLYRYDKEIKLPELKIVQKAIEQNIELGKELLRTIRRIANMSKRT